jgi:hypothetical protein
VFSFFMGTRFECVRVIPFVPINAVNGWTKCDFFIQFMGQRYDHADNLPLSGDKTIGHMSYMRISVFEHARLGRSLALPKTPWAAAGVSVGRGSCRAIGRAALKN